MTTPTSDGTGKSVHYYRKDGLVLPVKIPEILVPIEDGMLAMHSSDIIYISKDGNKSKIMCRNNKSHIVDSSIQEIEEKLSKIVEFVRINNSTIINKSLIKNIKKGKSIEVILDNGEEFLIEEKYLTNIITD